MVTRIKDGGYPGGGGAGWRMGGEREYKKYMPTFSPNTRPHLVKKMKLESGLPKREACKRNG